MADVPAPNSLPINSTQPTPRSVLGTERPLRSLHLGFVLTGMITTVLGPILPSLSARWRLDDFHSGLLFTAQFVGSMVGVLLSSLLLTRRGYRLCLVFGFVCMGLGVGSLGVGSWGFGIASALGYGLGLGLTIPATNLLVAEWNPNRSAAALSLLNLAWGAGAVAFPVVAAAFLRSHHLRILLATLGAAALVLSLALAVAVSPAAGREISTTQSHSRFPLAPADWWTLLILGLLFFLYVGTENGLAGWIASYTRRLGPGGAAGWALMPSFFWGTLLLGRASAPLFLRAGNEVRLARAGLLVGAAGGLVVVQSTGFAGIAAGAALAGLGLSAVFPITIARLSSCFGRAASRFVGAMFALGGLGGATLPWLVGFVSTRLGSLRSGLWMPVACSLVMFALYFAPSLSRLAPSHLSD